MRTLTRWLQVVSFLFTLLFFTQVFAKDLNNSAVIYSSAAHFQGASSQRYIVPYSTDKLYIVSMMHAEDFDFFKDHEVRFNEYADYLEAVAELFHEFHGKIDFGPDWTFIQGVRQWRPGLLMYLQALGHGVHTHAHETTMPIDQVNQRLETVGIANNAIANGGFGQSNFVNYLAQFQDGAFQRFQAIVGYKDPSTNIPSDIGYCFRPSVTGDWQTEDSSGPLMYIGSNTPAVVGGGELNFNHLESWILDRLQHLNGGRINTLYWHDSLHNYTSSAAVDARLTQWRQLLAGPLRDLVLEGKVEWATFEEMLAICRAFEADNPS